MPSFLLLLYSNFLLATPACPIVSQSFQNSANGATSDPSATGWYLDASHVSSPAYFAIQSHRLKAQTLGGEGVWYSQVFSIAGYTNIQVDAKISSEGTFTSSEYVKVYYKLNGGPETLISAQYGSFGTPTITSPMMTGSTVQIVVRIYNVTAGPAYYYIEKYDVFKETGPCGVAGISVNASASNAGILTCSNPASTLTATTTATGTTTWSWAGPNGYTASGNSVSVNAPGSYTVTGNNAAGTGSASVTVTANNAAPDVTATGANLVCATSGTISASSSVSGATYSWTGPNGFSSSMQNPTVTATGAYNVTVRNPATGCTASTSVNVTSGVQAPVTFWLEDFTWPNGTTVDTGTTPWTSTSNGTGTYTYSVQNNEFKTTFTGQKEGVWTSGQVNLAGKTNTVLSVDLRSETASVNDAFENTDYIRVYLRVNNRADSLIFEDLAGIGSSTAGTASTTLTSGVINGDSVRVIIRTSNSDPTERYYFDNVKLTGTPQALTAVATGGVLTCSVNSVVLSGSSGAANASYSWTGPGGFSSALQNPVVTVSGIYTLTVSSNGCTATDTALVSQNAAGPAGLVVNSSTGGTILSCTNPSIILTAGSSTPGVSYSWTGPGGYNAAGSSATITTAGNYVLTATDPVSGCTVTNSTQISQNISAPAGISTTSVPLNAQLNCTASDVVLTGSSTTPGVIYAWSGPDGFSASTAVATAITPGSYLLTVTNPANGCISTATAVVTQDLTPPASVTATPSNQITCAQSSASLTGNSTTPDVTYAWTGPGGFSSSSRITSTTVAGSYTLVVTNTANGCTASKPITVQQNKTAPANVTIAPPDQLNCDVTTVDLIGSSTTPNVLYIWSGPNDFSDVAPVTTVAAPGDYTLTVTNPVNGCSSVATVTVEQDLSACEAAARKVTVNGKSTTLATGSTGLVSEAFTWKVYPNPVNSVAFVDLVSPVSSHVEVGIYNSMGIREKLLFEGQVEAHRSYKLSIGASSLPSGIHFCIIKTDGKVYSTKLLSSH